MNKLLCALCFVSTFAHSSDFTYSVKQNIPLLMNTKDAESLKKFSEYSEYYFSDHTDKIPNQKSPWLEKAAVPDTFFDDKTSSYAKDYIFPISQKIVLSAVDNLLESGCEWSVNGKVLLDKSCQSVEASIPFTTKTSTYYEAVATVSLSVNGQEFTKQIVSKDYIVAALGDSYASGEGAPDIPKPLLNNEDDRQWWFAGCHRSLLAWPSLVTALIASKDTKNSYRFVSRACSGAVIADVAYDNTMSKYNFTSKGKWGRENTDLSQAEFLLNDLSNGNEKRQPTFIMLSAGGNDAHFSKVITDSFLWSIRTKNNIKVKYQKMLEADKNYIKSALTSLSKDISNKFPDSTIIHAIYPEPVHRKPNLLCLSGKSRNKLDFGQEYRGFYQGNHFTSWFGSIFQVKNKENVILFEDFIAPFTGSVAVNETRSDYLGLKHWSDDIALSNENWHVLITRNNMKKNGHQQIEGYQTHGYCVTGSGYEGAWFNSLDDSLTSQEDKLGSIHPNIYGQLYYTYRMFIDYSNLLNKSHL